MYFINCEGQGSGYSVVILQCARRFRYLYAYTNFSSVQLLVKE